MYSTWNVRLSSACAAWKRLRSAYKPSWQQASRCVTEFFSVSHVDCVGNVEFGCFAKSRETGITSERFRERWSSIFLALRLPHRILNSFCFPYAREGPFDTRALKWDR